MRDLVIADLLQRLSWAGSVVSALHDRPQLLIEVVEQAHDPREALAQTVAVVERDGGRDLLTELVQREAGSRQLPQRFVMEVESQTQQPPLRTGCINRLCFPPIRPRRACRGRDTRARRSLVLGRSQLGPSAPVYRLPVAQPRRQLLARGSLVEGADRRGLNHIIAYEHRNAVPPVQERNQIVGRSRIRNPDTHAAEPPSPLGTDRSPHRVRSRPKAQSPQRGTAPISSACEARGRGIGSLVRAMMSAARVSFLSAYWLAHCAGFQVECPEGRVGYVEEVRFGSSGLEPEAIVVSAGLFAKQRLLIPTDQIEAVVPEREQIALRAAPSTEDLSADLATRIAEVKEHAGFAHDLAV